MSLFAAAAKALGSAMGSKTKEQPQKQPDRKRMRAELMRLMEAEQPSAAYTMPKNRATGGMRGKNESREEFRERMDRNRMPRGLGRAGSGLDYNYALQDRNLTPEEARMKASIIRSEGGRINRGGTMSKNVRMAPESSTGSTYDPVANRKRMMAEGRAAIAERRNLQESDRMLAGMRQAEINTPGYQRTMNTPYGTASAKTLTEAEFDARKPAMTPLSRAAGTSIPLKSELSYLRNRQKRAGMPKLPPLKA